MTASSSSLCHDFVLGSYRPKFVWQNSQYDILKPHSAAVSATALVQRTRDSISAFEIGRKVLFIGDRNDLSVDLFKVSRPAGIVGDARELF